MNQTFAQKGLTPIGQLAYLDTVPTDPVFTQLKNFDDAMAGWKLAQKRVPNDGTIEEIRAAEDVMDEACRDVINEFAILLETTPSTVQGCAALLRRTQQWADWFSENPFREFEGGKTLLARIAETLETLERAEYSPLPPAA